MKYVIWSIALILAFALMGYFMLRPESRPFRFGLDLVGGTELIYRADTTGVSNISSAMETLKEVIERRVNVFGVSEPLVQVERAGVISGNPTERLIVELPGYKDVEEAKNALGKTPILEFRLVPKDHAADDAITETSTIATLLTGRYLNRAAVEFSQVGQALVNLQFNDEGREIFAKITKENIGSQLAIFLDHQPISAPVIQEEIRDGQAQITGNFPAEEAKVLVRNLNYGALPIPIEFAGSQLIGATLGESALKAGIKAGIIGFVILSIFLIFWYRLPGVVSVIALVIYIILTLTLFKLIPVTLTAAGLAGFILSIGMAVDANVLIFERTKEELKKGKSITEALHEGFRRAWLSIRDSNISSIITAVVLFWLGTSAVKGFALTLLVGVIVSMFTAITVSRTFLFALAPKNENNFKRFLFSNGIHFK